MNTKKSLPKKGDKIYWRAYANGNSSGVANTVLTVNTISNARSLNPYFSASSHPGANGYTIYLSDNWVYADRDYMKTVLSNEIKDLSDKIKEKQKELDFLNKYASEEEFVADKLDSILTAHSKSGNKKDRISAITDVLKTLKESNLL